MMTQERADKLVKILDDAKENAVELFALSPQEAVAKINALGHDFTVEELEAFGRELAAMAADGDEELSEDQLEKIAGGRSQQWRVERPGVPIFDRGGRAGQSRRIIRTLNQGQIVTGERIVERDIVWVRLWGSDMFVNSIHLWPVR